MTETLGLKKLRKKTGSKPEYHCDNCGCDRYSTCTCTRNKKKQKKEQE